MSKSKVDSIDAVRSSGKADLIASVNELAKRTTQLTHAVDRIIALAQSRTHESEAKGISSTATVESANFPLSPVLEGASELPIETKRAESLLATGVADLHERLGGFISEALLKPRVDGENN